MNKTIKLSVDKKNIGKRLDIFLSQNINDFTRSYIKKLIEDKQVTLNNVIKSSPSIKIKFKDTILVNIIENKTFSLKPKYIKLNIIFEDRDIIVLNKPKGMVVHPGAGNYENTLVNALLFKYKKKII